MTTTSTTSTSTSTSTTTTSRMVYCCCLCQEEDSATVAQPVKEDKPLLSTKCGHIFHYECLHKCFSKSGDNIAWGPKTCPACKTSLIIATDIIRLFPTSIAASGPGPNTEELTARVNQLKSQITELNNRLEVSFLKYRESEKAAAQYRTENEVLRAKFGAHMQQQNTESASRIDWLMNENHHLKNTVASLTNSLMECHNRMSQPQFTPLMRPPRPYFPPIFNSAVVGSRPFPTPRWPYGNGNPGILGDGNYFPKPIQRPPAIGKKPDEDVTLSGKFSKTLSLSSDDSEKMESESLNRNDLDTKENKPVQGCDESTMNANIINPEERLSLL